MRFRVRPRRDERFEDVLARCLASIEDGGATIESCLAAHPAQAVRLEPALRTAMSVRGRLAAGPDPAFVQRTRARMLAAAAARRPRPVPVPAPAVARGHTWLRPVAGVAAAAVVMLVALFVPMLSVTSADALPGDWNYGIKLATEDVQLKFGITDHLDLVERRAEEIARLAEKGRTDQIPSVARAYQEELDQATAPLKAEAPPKEAQKIQEKVERSRSLLSTALEKVEQQAQPAAVEQVTPPRATSTATSAAAAASTATSTETPASTPTATPPATVPATASPARPASPASVASLQSALNATNETQQRVAQVVPSPPRAPLPTLTPSAVATGAATPSPTAPPPAGGSTPESHGVTIPAMPGDGTPLAPAPPAGTPAATATAPAPAAAQITATPTPSPTPEPNLTPARRTVTPLPASAPTVAAPPRAAATAATAPPAPAASRPIATAPAATTTPAAVTTPAPVPARQATVAPTEEPTRPATPVAPTVELAAGVNQFMYCGATAPVSLALGVLDGHYAWVQWVPPGSRTSMRYTPGDPGRIPIIVSGSQVTIVMTDSTTVLADVVCRHSR